MDGYQPLPGPACVLFFLKGFRAEALKGGPAPCREVSRKPFSWRTDCPCRPGPQNHSPMPGRGGLCRPLGTGNASSRVFPFVTNPLGKPSQEGKDLAPQGGKIFFLRTESGFSFPVACPKLAQGRGTPLLWLRVPHCSHTPQQSPHGGLLCAGFSFPSPVSLDSLLFAARFPLPPPAQF